MRFSLEKMQLSGSGSESRQEELRTHPSVFDPDPDSDPDSDNGISLCC